MDRVTRFQALDLARGIAAVEATPFLSFIRVVPSLRSELPRLARLALPDLEAEEGVPPLAGVPGETGSAEDLARVTAVIVAVARAVVPTHAQSVAMYGWLEALVTIEADERLVDAPLPADVRQDLRALCHAVLRIQSDVEAAQRAFADRWGGDGGWAQLLSIAQWAVFCNVWTALVARVGGEGIDAAARTVAGLAMAKLNSPLSFIPTIAPAELTS